MSIKNSYLKGIQLIYIKTIKCNMNIGKIKYHYKYSFIYFVFHSFNRIPKAFSRYISTKTLKYITFQWNKYY